MLGYIETIRGRNGGIRLLMPPAEINIGELVLKTEEDFYLVECFHHDKERENRCLITPACHLKGILNEALAAFIHVLKGYTLADLIENNTDLTSLFEKS